jgi:ATP-binding cassette subfamily F protein 3
VIVKDTSVEIDRGDKIALIGANGKGKSTLLRIIAGTESIDGGERKWGHNVEESFYAQHQLEALNVNNTVLDEMKGCGSQMTELELRGLLGCFLFSGDDADKKIKILSGGEKARVALAKVIVSKANFLMLDEPTNHLDMHSCDLLIEALNKYQGSIILVSHDRYFISKTANKIWEIVDHKVKEFKGGYEEWVAWNERMARQKSEILTKKTEIRNENPKKTEKPNEPGGTNFSKSAVQTPRPGQQSQPINKEMKKELQKQQKIFQQLEEKIGPLTEKKAALEASLVDPAVYSDKTKFLQAESAYKNISQELEKLNLQYEKTFELIVSLEGGTSG